MCGSDENVFSVNGKYEPNIEKTFDLIRASAVSYLIPGQLGVFGESIRVFGVSIRGNWQPIRGAIRKHVYISLFFKHVLGTCILFSVF